MREEEGHTRPLADDSESEVEPAEIPCQAVLVGICDQGYTRPLCVADCRDEATREDTRLLFEDAVVSDLPPCVEKGGPTVKLCAHHQQLYRATLPERKCSRTLCYHSAASRPDGIPLCKDHAGSVTKVELGSFQGLRNRFICGRGRQQETSHRERGSSRDNKNDRDKETNRNLSTPGGKPCRNSEHPDWKWAHR